jgi:hypothetical protein
LPARVRAAQNAPLGKIALLEELASSSSLLQLQNASREIGSRYDGSASGALVIQIT